MFLTVHAPVGAAIGALAGEPVSAFALGVLSHFVLDAIPHGDERLGNVPDRAAKIRLFVKLAALDGLIMLMVLAYLFTPWVAIPSLAVLAGILGGIMPDFLQGFSELLPGNRPLAAFRRFHDYMHVHLIPWESPLMVGLVTQLITLVAIAYGLTRII